jgi:signal peptidase I
MINEIYKKQGGSIGGFVLDFIQSIVLALAVFVLLYLFVAQPNEVNGSSMLPNFTDKEFLLTEKLSYQFGKPQRGDVVIFKAPASEPCSPEECEYIKRVIGIPGDEVMVKDGQVYLNGQLLNQDFLPEGIITDPGQYAKEGVTEIIPEGQYLCFGDNRQHSRDGREFGPIKENLIVGKAFLKYWPISAVGLVPTVRL